MRLQVRVHYQSLFAAEKSGEVTEVPGFFVQDLIVVNQNHQKEGIIGGQLACLCPVLVSQHLIPTRQNCPSSF